MAERRGPEGSAELLTRAFAAYQREPGGAYRAHAVIVLALSPAGITRIVIFLEPDLFTRFGLPHLRS